MFLVYVDSTTLYAIAYDEIHQLLELEFRSRAVYHYAGVSPSVHQALLSAPSVGCHFNQFIRGQYRYCLITGGSAGQQPGKR